MRSHFLSILTGTVGLAAIVTAAPALSSFGVCGSNVSTVFITVPQETTVTIHDAETKTATIYLSAPTTTMLPTTTITVRGTDTETEIVYIPASTTILPTTTVTRVYTLFSTQTDYVKTTSLGAAALATPISYETTVTQTATVTVTRSNTTPATSSGALFTFVLNSGTTFWLGGHTPTSSYVVKTSVITIVPVNTPVSEDRTSTETLNTTIITTRATHTLTKTLTAMNQTSGASPVGHDHASSWGGWNVTSTAGGVVFPGATSAISFITSETVDIYKPSSTSYTLSSYLAKSGFNAMTAAPSSFWFSATPTASSTAEGVWTTSVTNGQTVSWNANGTNQTGSETLSGAQHVNTTTASLQSTSTADGALASSSSHAPQSSYLLNSTGAAFGTVTSMPVSSDIATTSSKWYIYRALSSMDESSLTTSAALGNFTPASLNTTSVSSDGITSMPISTHMGVFPTGTETALPTPTYSSVIGMLPTDIESFSLVLSSATAFSPASAKATPTPCGLRGDFVLNFDDIPPLSVSNDSTFSQPAPVFSPYHKFDFSNGFTVVPPPVDPYLPNSKPLLLEFIPNFTINASTTATGPNSAEGGFSGEMGNFDHGATGCFNFNFYGASLGCDSSGAACDFTFTGFKYDRAANQTRSVVTQEISVAACPSLRSLDCVLTPVVLDGLFTDLDSVRISVTAEGRPKIWWMDDVRLGWSDNSCEKGICRTLAPIHH